MKVHEVSPGQPLAKARNPASVILLQLSRFSVVSPGQLGKACTPISEIAGTERSSGISPGQPLAKACTPTSVILAQSQRFSVVSPGPTAGQSLQCSIRDFVVGEPRAVVCQGLHSDVCDLVEVAKIQRCKPGAVAGQSLHSDAAVAVFTSGHTSKRVIVSCERASPARAVDSGSVARKQLVYS